VLAVSALVLGGIAGFLVGSSRAPNDVLVPGRPTTLHLNRLPPFPKIGRQCVAILSTYLLSFDYSNGDKLTVDVRPSPCGMVTVLGDDTPRAEAVDSALLNDVTTQLKPH